MYPMIFQIEFAPDGRLAMKVAEVYYSGQILHDSWLSCRKISSQFKVTDEKNKIIANIYEYWPTSLTIQIFSSVLFSALKTSVVCSSQPR